MRSSFEAVIAGEVAVCDVIRLELLGKPEWERAPWVYGRLAEQGGLISGP